uniref:Protein krueppel n=1 Tax=Clastoptera arizonana TaxID=38151 RepID=A0A1B6CCX3_9HEMI
MFSWFSDSGIAEADTTRGKDMTTINTGLHEVPGVRLPLQTSFASANSHSHTAVFMYSSTTGEGSVTLQLRDTDELDDKNGGLASVLARLQQEDATLSISYQDPEMLTEGSIDVLLGAGPLHSNGNGASNTTFDLFDSESGQDLTLSPQTFTSSTEAFINDNSNSLGVPGADTDTVGSSEDIKGAPDSSKLTVKKPRPKASSPNRQGPQQCQVCGKVFGNASALAKHKLTHSDERKYVCSMCGKAFKRQDHLNGHMLTHRNKKPYECKAEGCGKSYCDARSLRRHTENHHSGSSAVASSTTSPAPSSPLAATCIQYAPPPPAATPPSSVVTKTTTPSQLQRLLASETPSSTPSSSTISTKTPNTAQHPNNDGLTKQQLDLIHQIMQQTQQQAAQLKQHNANNSNNPGNSSSTVVKTTTASTSTSSIISSTKTKTWTVQTSSCTTASKAVGTISSIPVTNSNLSTTNVSSATTSTITSIKTDPKPVECNLCHRKFKNIPALNGHMRLHGGYFKKDSDSKKCEKKETTGPPLQTASISVRALIEEKIIQKRITNPSLASHVQTNITYSTAEPTQATAPPQYPGTPPLENGINIKGSSFVVPAVPNQLTAVNGGDKNTMLRRHSDSEHFVSPRTPPVQSEVLSTSTVNSTQPDKTVVKTNIKRASSDPGTQQQRDSPQLHLNFQNDTGYSLEVYSNEDGSSEYFSSSLQEDVFQQVQSVQDSMLLHGVDPAQLAESIQAATLQDIASLEDYQNTSSDQQYQHHHDLQSVLNSPLPVSLADFAYSHNQAITTNKDYQTNDSKEFVSYSQSPLPSPSFTYPTPPASQEGQSPSFGQLQSVISGPASSPLSAAFYTSTMSSSAAVEAALNEVLPLDSNQHVYPSPPPQSPLSATPVPSPLSLPASSSSPVPHHTLQSQMMPNSDDPLLSSSPKDFGSRKRFDFHTFKLLNNGTINLGNAQGVTGIVLDRNGELKLIQTSGNFQPMKTTAGLMNGTAAVFVNTRPKSELSTNIEGNHKVTKSIVSGKTISIQKIQQSPKSQAVRLLDHIKEEVDDDVFLSPTSVPASPIRVCRKRPRYEISNPPHPSYQSRLRTSRIHHPAAPILPYTPTPILPPGRNGQGLYWQAVTTWPSSTTPKGEFPFSDECGQDISGVAPETDMSPHVNIGPQYQCVLPKWIEEPVRIDREPSFEHLLWDPGISKLTSENEVDMYLEFACCAAVPGGGRNKEYALHLLHLCHGNIHVNFLVFYHYYFVSNNK